ncbi:hypothetical protein FM037_21815 [Shewanella psychropiezotolerans]|uniref:Uncharacterized protein n=2 Tax=Shewanella TaxID=22 RepID=A0A1S6HQ34_9GAMM|nr:MULTISPECIES: hypothetical protein [Shewanella]AQS37619.1 hypothetical protein Sps_02465 [Shewanella psychrophila]MPY23313.1 hypothetical protein [Shewanella sp. YLB-07]QDO85404.1 hypothetical protein FM037_21815 [Shewanella psychropiezotolerans]
MNFNIRSILNQRKDESHVTNKQINKLNKSIKSVRQVPKYMSGDQLIQTFKNFTKLQGEIKNLKNKDVNMSESKCIKLKELSEKMGEIFQEVEIRNSDKCLGKPIKQTNYLILEDKFKARYWSASHKANSTKIKTDKG